MIGPRRARTVILRPANDVFAGSGGDDVEITVAVEVDGTEDGRALEAVTDIDALREGGGAVKGQVFDPT
ncbi:MAG: hypothetical protein AAGM22_29675 [Acidobacteriota bacterium]